MVTGEVGNTAEGKRVVVIKNGPYAVEGDVPLTIKKQVEFIVFQR